MVRLSALKSARNRRGSSADRIEIAASRIAAGQPSVRARAPRPRRPRGRYRPHRGRLASLRSSSRGRRRGRPSAGPTGDSARAAGPGRIAWRARCGRFSGASRTRCVRSPSTAGAWRRCTSSRTRTSGSARAPMLFNRVGHAPAGSAYHEVVGSERAGRGARRARSRSTAAVAPARCRPRRARPNGSSALPWRCGPSRREASSCRSLPARRRASQPTVRRGRAGHGAAAASTSRRAGAEVSALPQEGGRML